MIYQASLTPTNLLAKSVRVQGRYVDLCGVCPYAPGRKAMHHLSRELPGLAISTGGLPGGGNFALRPPSLGVGLQVATMESIPEWLISSWKPSERSSTPPFLVFVGPSSETPASGRFFCFWMEPLHVQTPISFQ